MQSVLVHVCANTACSDDALLASPRSVCVWLQANVFVVGDPDQAIYGWRGANVVNMQQSFHTDYPGDLAFCLKIDAVAQAYHAAVKSIALSPVGLQAMLHAQC